MTTKEAVLSVAAVRPVEDLPEEEVVSLRQLVRERLELSADPDPHRAINGMVAELPEDVLRQAAQVGLVSLAKEVVRGGRQRVVVPQGSAKWDAVREAAAEHRDVFAERVWVGGALGWKFMADCTKVDLSNAAEVKRTQANGLLADVERFEKLARVLKRDQTVSDLDRAKVETIFNA